MNQENISSPGYVKIRSSSLPIRRSIIFLLNVQESKYSKMIYNVADIFWHFIFYVLDCTYNKFTFVKGKFNFIKENWSLSILLKIIYCCERPDRISMPKLNGGLYLSYFNTSLIGKKKLMWSKFFNFICSCTLKIIQTLRSNSVSGVGRSWKLHVGQRYHSEMNLRKMQP